MTLRDLRSVFLALVIGALLTATCRAGYGRQTLVVEADYGEGGRLRWIEHNADAIQKSTGAKILDTHGDLVTLQIDTKYGTQASASAARVVAATTWEPLSTARPAR